jgi:hypothetical protein
VKNDRSSEYLASLVRELCALPRETEWVEFKVNDAEPQDIGEQVSALANAPALANKPFRLSGRPPTGITVLDGYLIERVVMKGVSARTLEISTG